MSKLAAKLADVMKAVERIPKNGWNDFHKYKFATEADIADAIRGELAARQVVLVPGITGMEREKVGDKGQVLTTLFMTMTFIDGESGEQIERPWLGAGADKEDKGHYKAMTGGEKYFLLKTFLVPTGDDPEADGTKHTTPHAAGSIPPLPRVTGPSVPNGGDSGTSTLAADMNAAVGAGYKAGLKTASSFKAPVRNKVESKPEPTKPVENDSIPF